MCFGCSKELSHQEGSFEFPQHMFWLRNKKNTFQLCTLILGPGRLFKKFVEYLVYTCGSGYLYFWLLGEDLLVGVLLGVVISYLLMILLDLVVVIISVYIIITIVTRILYTGWIFCENIQ